MKDQTKLFRALNESTNKHHMEQLLLVHFIGDAMDELYSRHKKGQEVKL